MFLITIPDGLKSFPASAEECRAKSWRKLHNEELHNLYSSPSIITIIMSRKMRWAGHAARMGEKRNAYRMLVGELGERPIGRPRYKWVDYIQMRLLSHRMGWYGLN
jgi:hypothetical protein